MARGWRTAARRQPRIHSRTAGRRQRPRPIPRAGRGTPDDHWRLQPSKETQPARFQRQPARPRRPHRPPRHRSGTSGSGRSEILQTPPIRQRPSGRASQPLLVSFTSSVTTASPTAAAIIKRPKPKSVSRRNRFVRRRSTPRPATIRSCWVASISPDAAHSSASRFTRMIRS